MAISPARLSAYDILLQIGDGRGFSSELLAVHAETLEERDRGLCHELTLGVLRRQIYLDRVTDAFSGAKKLDAEIRIAIRLGLYQILYLDRVPAYSAINDSVELVKRAKKVSAKGFVNAILRRATREAAKIVFADEVDRISVESSHPRWMVEKWTRDFGEDFAGLLAHANNEQPRVSFRLTARGMAQNDPALSRFLDSSAFASDDVSGCYLADNFSPELRELEERGLIYFQDEASQLVASLAGAAAGSSFLDVCASPGGKTTEIAAGMTAGSFVAAGDLTEKRVALLKSNCIRQGLESISVVRYDAESALPFAEGTFSGVLVDAPCSGTGTIRHNPEIRYRLSADDFFVYAKRQSSILNSAAEMVAAGGRLIYSTCSFEVEENENVIEAFMSTNADFRLMRPNVPDEFVTDDGFARTYPSRDNMDGFFIAVLERAAD